MKRGTARDKTLIVLELIKNIMYSQNILNFLAEKLSFMHRFHNHLIAYEHDT